MFYIYMVALDLFCGFWICKSPIIPPKYAYVRWYRSYRCSH